MRSFYQNNWLLFSVVIGIYTAITFFSENWIFTEEYYYQSFSGQLPDDAVEDLLESSHQYWWMAYFSQVVMLLFKIFFAVLCIFIGVVLSDLKTSFHELFRSVVIAEVVFITAQLIYLYNLYNHRSEITIETTIDHYPLSVLMFLGTENVASWLHYPLQTMNIFELVYILFVSWLLSREWKIGTVDTINIVLPSYGTGLLIWMVLVVFLTIQIT